MWDCYSCYFDSRHFFRLTGDHPGVAIEASVPSVGALGFMSLPSSTGDENVDIRVTNKSHLWSCAFRARTGWHVVI